MDFLAILGYMVHIAKGGAVDSLNLAEYLVLAPLIEHLELLVEADPW